MSQIQKIIDDCERYAEHGIYLDTNHQLLIMFLRAMDVLVDVIEGKGNVREQTIKEHLMSKGFEEEACQYCKEAGWRSPA